MYGATHEKHYLALDEVLQRIQVCGLTQNKNKCVFANPHIQFFVVIFSRDGLLLAPEQITALQLATLPFSAAEAQSFLNIFSSQHHFKHW